MIFSKLRWTIWNLNVISLQEVHLSVSQAALIAVTGVQNGISADVRAYQEMVENVLTEEKLRRHG